MTQAKNLPALPQQPITSSVLDFFKDVEFKPTFRQYQESNIIDDNLNLSGSQLARYHIGFMLSHIYQIIGLRETNYPSKELSKTIARYIQKTYYYLTPDDLYKAFEYALQGKFKCGNDHLEHFQIMDVKYLNRVLSSYSTFRLKIMNKIKEKSLIQKVKERMDWLIAARPKDDEAVKSMVLRAYQSIEKKEDSPTYLRVEYFDWLVDIELIDNGDQENKIGKMISIFQEWDLIDFNPMLKRFNEVCYLAPDNTIELSKLKTHYEYLLNQKE